MRSVSAIIIISFIYLITSVSCAKVNSSGPSGGPQDLSPPRVVSSEPENASVNFSEKKFEITFDEFFVLMNVNQKLMISPPLENRPEIKVKGKSLIVSFEEELRENATYNFYFQDAIQDLNENNPIQNFQYVFSTGPTLDSLSLTGHIYNASNLEAGEEVFVLLYSSTDDTIPRTTLPEYITRALPDGKFRINNIKEGEYCIYGLIDMNNNKNYDLEDESFAFLDSLIKVSASGNYIPEMPDTLKTASDSAIYERTPGKEILLYYFTTERKQQYLTSTSREKAFRLMFTFALPVDSGMFDISFPGEEYVDYIIEESTKRDTFLIWLKDSAFYSTERISTLLTFPETDSTGNIVSTSDSIDLRYFAPGGRGRAAAREDAGLIYRTNIRKRGGLAPGERIFFDFETPAAEPDTSLIKLYLLSDTLRIKQDYRMVKDTLKTRRYFVDANLKMDSSYLFIVNEKAFSDIFGNVSDSTGSRFQIRNSESFGKLILNLSGYEGKLIVQLLKSDESLVAEKKINLQGDAKIEFPYLEKGNYRIKGIYDQDENGEWTTGNFDQKKQPEIVSYFEKQLEVKINWDIEDDWVLKGERSKEPGMLKSNSGTNRSGY